jgi:hypothetical protein
VSRVDVGYQKIAEMKGRGGDVISCRGLPLNGRRSGKRGAVTVCQYPRRFGVHEGRGRAATSCRDLSEDRISMGEMLGNMAGTWQRYVLQHKGCMPSRASSGP